ncbi:MAG: hypothetical protein ACOCRO_08035 [Halanaerobiales bacterium]
MKEELEKNISRELLFAKIFVFLGSMSLLLAILNLQRGVMIGLTAGFLPVGILSWYSFARLNENKENLKKYEASNDERNVFIRLKAGYLAFWFNLWIVFALQMLNNFFEIPFRFVGVGIIIIMVLSYFSFLAYYNKKY